MIEKSAAIDIPVFQANIKEIIKRYHELVSPEEKQTFLNLLILDKRLYALISKKRRIEDSERDEKVKAQRLWEIEKELENLISLLDFYTANTSAALRNLIRDHNFVINTSGRPEIAVDILTNALNKDIKRKTDK